MVSNVEPGVPRGRGGWSAFLGAHVRKYLLEHGPSNPEDIHEDYKRRVAGIAVTTKGNPWRVSTYHSFVMWLRMAGRLGLVYRLSETQPPKRQVYTLYTTRTLWDLTDLGRQQEDLWVSVRKQLYPVAPEVQKQYGTAQRQRRKQRLEALKQLAGPPPAERERREPRPPIEEPAPPLASRRFSEPTSKVPILESLDQLFDWVARESFADQSAAQIIVLSLRQLQVDESLIAPVEATALSYIWRGDTREQRDAWIEFQAVVKTLRRAMELRSGLS